MRENFFKKMNCNERADNMSKRKLADDFKPGNNTPFPNSMK